MGPRGAAGPPGKNGEDVSNLHIVSLRRYKELLKEKTSLVYAVYLSTVKCFH